MPKFSCYCIIKNEGIPRLLASISVSFSAMASEVIINLPPDEVNNLQNLVVALQSDERFKYPHPGGEPFPQEYGHKGLMSRVAIAFSKWEDFQSHVHCDFYIEFRDCRAGWFAMPVSYHEELCQAQRETYSEIRYVCPASLEISANVYKRGISSAGESIQSITRSRCTC